LPAGKSPVTLNIEKSSERENWMNLALRDLSKDKKSSLADGGLYRFGQFSLDSRKRSVFRLDSPVTLTPKAFDVLLFLVQNPNRLVTKEELLQAVWGDAFVEEGNLTQYISHLRKALDDNSEDTRLIVTIARKGYQLTANVAVAESADTPKQTAVQIPIAQNSLADAHLALQTSAAAAIAKAPMGWRKLAFASASSMVLAVVCFASWHRFEGLTPQSSRKIMIAVLPFENLTGDPNKEYLADGLTEETIAQLGRLNPHQLGVIARTSVMGYKHKNERLDRIGRDLSVQYVLENSLRQSGNRLRLTAQLIQVKDQTHLWAQDYDYPANDVLSVEDDLAKAVVHEIRVRLASQQQSELAQSHPADPAAFDAYLQAYYYFERDTDKDTNMAATYFERATQLDPNYALAWVGLSRARNWQAVVGLIPSEAGHQSAREAVERALALDPNLALAHAQMARIKRQVDFDWAGAANSIQKAIALEPGNPEILRFAASLTLTLGRTDEALRLARQAVDLDPLNARSWEVLGELEFEGGKLDEAEAHCKKSRELRPDDYHSHLFLSEIYLMEGRPQDALPEIARVSYEPLRTFLYAIAYHALGRKRESDAALGEFIAKSQATNAYTIAEIYAFRGQPDEAFAWLDRAYANRDDGLIFSKVEPLLKCLHNDPRFPALLKKLNLPA
jgi:TolB-like protein/DNA-binding winged helix-turn-helix (wHTH) protein